MNFRLLLNVRPGNTTVKICRHVPGLTFHGVWVCEIRGLWELVTLIGSNERLQARLILDAVRESLHVHDAAFTPLHTFYLPIVDSILTLKFQWRANVILINTMIRRLEFNLYDIVTSKFVLQTS